MRPIIKQLPEQIINLISAGEVVERPVSVVKELVENSIDAGSTKITIELINGGLSKIKVTDNGIGMKPEEIPLALLPHSTSKISSEIDLFNIRTLGFRGEALPSIASVSKFKISSMIENEKLGYYYHYLNGKIISQGSVPMTKGTIIEVEDLFYNTPARLKHLSSNFTENSHIVDYIYKSALAHPNIAFTLINNQKIIYQTTNNNSILDLIGITYGIDVLKSMLEFSGTNKLYNIEGYTSNNQTFRSNRNGITILVNNRIIKNQNLIYAIVDAYKSIIPISKYPLCILKITCDPRLLDVNVHPSKLEIRFTDEMLLRNLITKTLLIAINQKPLIYQDVLVSSDTSTHLLEEEQHKSQINSSTAFNDIESSSYSSPNNKLTEKIDTVNDLSWDDFDTPITINQPINHQPIEKETSETELFEQDKQNNFFSNLHYIGQFNQTYLLLETNNELYIMDQHAAAERVNYEKTLKAFNNQINAGTIDLLVPLIINFNLTDLPNIKKIEPELDKIGLKMQYFGGTSYKVETIPTWIKEGTEQSAILDIVNQLLNKNNLAISVIYDNIAKQVSCKKSLKAHMNITLAEVETLLANLDKCDMPYTCPHGRPTLIKFTLYELEKLFKRVV